MANGKGRAISMQSALSTFNHSARLGSLKLFDMPPLRSWPAIPHDRQAEIDYFMRIPTAQIARQG